MSPAAPEPRKTLDPDRVAEWLARHPDFFVGREGLLQQLRIPHPEARGRRRCSNAWSMICVLVLNRPNGDSNNYWNPRDTTRPSIAAPGN